MNRLTVLEGHVYRFRYKGRKRVGKVIGSNHGWYYVEPWGHMGDPVCVRLKDIFFMYLPHNYRRRSFDESLKEAFTKSFSKLKVAEFPIYTWLKKEGKLGSQPSG